VEVVKGAGSALYGSGALGGVINVLTKEIGEDPMLWWRVYGGYYSDPIFDQWKWSDKTRYTNGQAIGWSSRFDDLGVAFSIQRLSDDGYREQDWLRRYSGFLKMKYDISSYQSITFSSSLFQQYRGDFLWWKDLANALRPADGQRNVTVSSLRFSNALNYKHFISDEFYFEIKAAHFRGNWRRDSLAIRRLDYSVSDAATTDVQGNILTSRDNMLTIGITGNYERVNADIFGIHYASGTAMYIQDEAAIAENISATAGLRYDIQRVIGLPLQRQTSPKAGIRYSWDEEQTLRASVGLGFRAPSIGELYTTTKNTGSSAIIVPSINLHPEESISYEISSTNALSKYVRLETAIFHSDYNNLIEPNVQSDTVLNAVTINFKNLTEARIQGIEISILTESFHRLLEIDVHYNYNWAVDTKTKSFLRFRPRHIASVNMEYRWNSQTFGMDYRFVSRIEAIDNKLVDLAPIKNGSQRVANHILDIRWIANLAEWSVPVRASLNIKNVLGYNYNELIGNISPPRHFVVSFEGILL
jgi:iron complex outermembrane receptor protein